MLVEIGGSPGNRLTLSIGNAKPEVVPATGGSVTAPHWSGLGLIGLVERACLAGGELFHGVDQSDRLVVRAMGSMADVTANGPVRVVIVDDEALVRAGLRISAGSGGGTRRGLALEPSQNTAADLHEPTFVGTPAARRCGAHPTS